MVTNIYAITLDWRILYWEQGNYGFSAREISHTHKYKQHVSQQLAFFEPAIKLWCKRDNFYQFCIIFFLFVLNVGTLNIAWAWNKLYNKHCGLFAIGLGSTLYWNVGELERHVLVSHRLNQQWHLDVDWYDDTRNAHEPNIVLYLSSNLDNHLCIFRLLYMLGSDTLMKFECSKLLRSSQAEHDYIFLLCRLSRNLTEPFRSRAQQQLKLILQFRNSEFPPANVPVQLLILDDEWNHKWGLGWKALSYITKSIFLLSTNPRYLFQSRVVLWGHIFSIFDCTCVGGTQLTDLLADAICYQRRAFLKHLMFLFSLLISLVSVLCTLLIWRTRSVHLGTSLWSCPISGLMCVYTVITNGFSSFHCSCTILKSRGQRYPCHFLCQRSWVTCGKDIDQGRLIYVPAIVSTVNFLFLFMSCALFLRSWICVRWNSTARQLRKSGEDYDIIHTFYWPLPHSVWKYVYKHHWDTKGILPGHFWFVYWLMAPSGNPVQLRPFTSYKYWTNPIYRMYNPMEITSYKS